MIYPESARGRSRIVGSFGRSAVTMNDHVVTRHVNSLGTFVLSIFVRSDVVSNSINLNKLLAVLSNSIILKYNGARARHAEGLRDLRTPRTVCLSRSCIVRDSRDRTSHGRRTELRTVNSFRAARAVGEGERARGPGRTPHRAPRHRPILGAHTP